MRKKVLFFLPAGIGGAERMTITIAKFLDESAYDVHFVILTGRHPENISNTMSFIPERYKVHILNIRIIWCFATLRIAALMTREKPAIVFSSLRYLNIRVILAAKMVGGIRVIVRNDNTTKYMTWYNRMLIRLSYPHADIVIAQQEEMAQELMSDIKLSEDKVKVVHNPIDTTTIDEKIKAPSPYTNSKESMRYVCVARLEKEKGQDLLLAAFNKVHAEVPTAHLYLVGKYDQSSKLYLKMKQFITDNKLEDYVHLVGFDSNPYRWVKYADCYVMPSRREGLPNALIEAMYIGKPVVSTKCIPIIERIVKDGYNGFLVPPDDADAMAQAMLLAPNLNNFTSTYRSTTRENCSQLFE